MATPRRQLISLSDTTWYHCVTRCVRRSWICGQDPYDGKDYSHRRQWVLGRIKHLIKAYSIEVASYAIMSNHYHLVLRVDTERVAQWSWQQVIEQWHIIHNGNMLSQRHLKGEVLPNAERKQLQKTAEEWRLRLSDISWFMRDLNEHVAKQANIEDERKGRFWESRFYSQALLDQQAILACMVYTDLNPLRAGMADTPEASDFTSIQQRIKNAIKGRDTKTLTRFQGVEKKQQTDGIPFSLKNYIELVEATGRIIRDDKRGSIAASQSPILKRLKIDTDTWHLITTTFEDSCGPWVGSKEKLEHIRTRNKKHWICKSEIITKLYPT